MIGKPGFSFGMLGLRIMLSLKLAVFKNALTRFNQSRITDRFCFSNIFLRKYAIFVKEKCILAG